MLSIIRNDVFKLAEYLGDISYIIEKGDYCISNHDPESYKKIIINMKKIIEIYEKNTEELDNMKSIVNEIQIRSIIRYLLNINDTKMVYNNDIKIKAELFYQLVNFTINREGFLKKHKKFREVMFDKFLEFMGKEYITEELSHKLEKLKKKFESYNF